MGTVKHNWLGAIAGNSRWHWAYGRGLQVLRAWERAHLDRPLHALDSEVPAGIDIPAGVPLYLASVVPAQTDLARAYPGTVLIDRDRLPLDGTYPTLGVDRALAAIAAGQRFGVPVAVVDAGTALTVTGVDGSWRFAGGAIWPGLGLQARALHEQTGTLPAIALPDDLPPRWAQTTIEAVQSGIVYGAASAIGGFLDSWWQQYPGSAVTLTGGDAVLVQKALGLAEVRVEPLLGLQGLAFAIARLASE